MKRKACELDDVRVDRSWQQSSSSSTITTSPESAHTNYYQSHLPSVPYFQCRTRKRHRDNRPNEETIHQQTMAKLYDAQRKLHENELAQQERTHRVDSYLMRLDTFEPEISSAHTSEPKQMSINSFFGGTNQRHFPSTRLQDVPSFQPDAALVCEDCASRLDGADNGMEVDIPLDETAWLCIQCRKQVCDMCAVRGDQRMCLECAVPGG